MNTKSKNNGEAAVFLAKKSWQFMGDFKKKYLLGIVSTVLTSIPSTITPLIVAFIINEIQGTGITSENVVHLLLLTSLIFILKLFYSLFEFFGVYYLEICQFEIKNNYKEYLLKGVMGLGLDWHSRRDSGDSIAKITKSSNGLSDFVAYLAWDLLKVLSVLVGFGAVLYFDILAGILAIFVFSIVSYIGFLFDKRLQRKYIVLNKFSNKISAKIFDTISNISSIIILRAQTSSYDEISRYIRAPEEEHEKTVFLGGTKRNFIIISFEFILVSVLMYFIYIAGFVGTEHGPGYIVALYLYLVSASEGLQYIVAKYGYYIKIKTDIENVEGIEKDFLYNPKSLKDIKDFSEVKISNLNFFYSDDEEKISGLKDASLTIKKGEHIAIVGPSGTGKSTLLKVINGLYEGAHCDLTVDGKETKDIDLSEYDLGTMLIPQEPEIFSATIRENITFCSDYPESDIQDAIKLAEFAEVVSRLPKGLESKINEKGVNLSGGEKQRLALARGLLVSQGKSILLLDEATSSVDSKNEVKIYKNILNKFTDKSVVATIHKLNLLRFFDKIVIFKHGAVVGVGTFEELLQSNKDFKRDWEQYIAKKEHEHQTESEE